jgi:uncharacterized membrane protein
MYLLHKISKYLFSPKGKILIFIIVIMLHAVVYSRFSYKYSKTMNTQFYKMNTEMFLCKLNIICASVN